MQYLKTTTVPVIVRTPGIIKKETDDHINKVRGSLNKFPDFFRMGTFIDSTHMKLYSPSN